MPRISLRDREDDDFRVHGRFWEVTLPHRMDTSSAMGPIRPAYYASLILLDARALFSKKKVRDALDPSVKAKKSAVERHHLFPRAYLKDLGIKAPRDINQLANFALVEWNDNIAISDTAPSEYLPKYEERFAEGEMAEMRYWHALPGGWEKMSYKEFLEERRKLMSKVIRDGYERLTKGESINTDEPDTYAEIIARGENSTAEFKSTLRVNLHTGQQDPKMEHAVLKTSSAAFLNTHGGTLCIGVNDDGDACGLESRWFPK